MIFALQFVKLINSRTYFYLIFVLYKLEFSNLDINLIILKSTIIYLYNLPSILIPPTPPPSSTL